MAPFISDCEDQGVPKGNRRPPVPMEAVCGWANRNLYHGPYGMGHRIADTACRSSADRTTIRLSGKLLVQALKLVLRVEVKFDHASPGGPRDPHASTQHTPEMLLGS